MNELFSIMALPLAACLLMGVVLGYLGLHVLKREIIFIDIAVAQVAALGMLIAHIFFHLHADSVAAILCSLGATLAIALFFALVRRHVTTLPIEATIGIIYAAAAAGTLFVIGKSTCGHTHIQEMLTGSLLWVSGRDIVSAAVVFALVGACLFMFHRKLKIISDDYESSARRGMRVVLWDFVFYALCGIVIAAAVRIAGVAVVFCFLIIPATVSALFTGNWNKRLLIACLVSAAGSLTGLYVSHAFDFSAGVSVSLMLGIILVLAAAVSRAGAT